MHYASISFGFLSLTCISLRPTVRLAEDSFSPIPSVETHNVSSKKLSHDGCHGSISGPQKQLHVVGHHSPCVVWRIHLLQQTRQPFEKFLPVLVIFENRLTFYSSNDDMVQGTGCVYAGLAGHTFQLRGSCTLVYKETTSHSFPIKLNRLISQPDRADGRRPSELQLAVRPIGALQRAWFFAIRCKSMVMPLLC